MSHPLHQTTVGTDVIDISAHDQPCFIRRDQLHVVSGPRSAIGHLHSPGIGIRRGATGLVTVSGFATVHFLGQFIHLLPGLFESLNTLTRCPFLSGFRTAVGDPRVFADIVLQRVDLRLRLGQILLRTCFGDVGYSSDRCSASHSNFEERDS